MLPATIDYILSLRDPNDQQVASLAQFQVIITNFPPLRTINYSVLPPSEEIRAYILYELIFGEAMVPHAFDVKVRHGADTVLDIIVGGRFTQTPFETFVVLGRRSPALLVNATNLRVLTNYYELTTSYVSINGDENYKTVMDALRRLATSTKLEQLAQDCQDLLRKLAGGGR